MPAGFLIIDFQYNKDKEKGADFLTKICPMPITVFKLLLLPHNKIQDHADDRKQKDDEHPEDLLPRVLIAFDAINNGNDIRN